MRFSNIINSRSKCIDHLAVRLSVLGVCLGTFVLLWPFLNSVMILGYQDDRYIQILAAPLMCLYLLYWDGANISSNIGYSPRVGFPLLFVGFVLALVIASRPGNGDQSTRLVLAMAVLVLVLQAGFILSFGLQTFRRAIYPLSLLWLLVPISPSVIDKFSAAYQQGSAATSYAILDLVGVSVLRDGTSFSIPGLDFRIAPECSGIRSGIAFLLVGLLASRLYLRSWWTMLLLIVSTVPITVFKNAIRIVVTTGLGAYVNRAFIDGPFHHQYGGIIFAPVDFLLFVPLLLALRRFDRTRVGAKQTEPVSVPALDNFE